MSKIGVFDIVSHTAKFGLYDKLTTPALTSIMPQVVSVWLEKLGHKIDYQIITSVNDLKNVDIDYDMVFISSFTVSAYLAYAMSKYFRNYGIITVLGGPHARSYKDDSLKYFDYVIGLCDKELIINLMDIAESHIDQQYGQYISAEKHPTKLASVEDRWKYIEIVNKKKSWIMPNIIPMLGSTGCPFNCEFCIDSKHKYQSMDLESIEKDLLFLQNVKEPVVMWHDPNFGVQFDKWMDLIKRTTINKRTIFLGELNLAKLTDNRVKQLARNGFANVSPGIESWSAFNNKTAIRDYRTKYDKVYETSRHVNKIARYIPIIQANIMFGLDCDTIEESFTLTKEFMRLTPTVYSNLQTLTVFGDSTPTYQEFKKQNRILNLPYNLMDGYSTTNVKINCDINTFYEYYYDITKYYNSTNMVAKRVFKTKRFHPRLLHLSRALFNGKKIVSYYKDFYNNLKYYEYGDFYNGLTRVPPFDYLEQIKNELGPFMKYLPNEIMEQFFYETM